MIRSIEWGKLTPLVRNFVKINCNEPLGTVLPLYRTGVSLLSRESFLHIKSINIFHYLIFS